MREGEHSVRRESVQPPHSTNWPDGKYGLMERRETLD